MVSDTPHRILLEGEDNSYQKDSGIADGVVSPGQLVDVSGTDTSGATTEFTFARNSTDGAVTVPRIAVELSKTGQTIDDDYADGDYLEFRTFQQGEEAYIQVFDGDNAGASGTDTSDNANIATGDYLVAYGGSGEQGTFRAYDSGDGDTEGLKLFQALEDQDNSGGTSPAFVRAVKV